MKTKQDKKGAPGCVSAFPADFQEPKWYVLFVRSNQEKRVAHGLDERGIEHFLPCYQAVRQWKDRRVKLEPPLFPGYVFARLAFIERIKALTVPNVISLVGSKHAPSVISEDEIQWIRHGIEHGRAEPHEYLKVGERVVITDGVLSGMEGILLHKRNGAKVVVSLDSIARSFAVEVDAACVKAISSATHGQAANYAACSAAAGEKISTQETLRRGPYLAGALSTAH